MVLALFILSIALAFAVSYGVSKLCRDVAEVVLNRFFARNVSFLTAKYLQFIVVFVGVSCGTRIRLLEDYIGAPAWNRTDLAAQLTPEVWALALYHTAIQSLEGIAWLVLLFGLLFVTALMGIRRSNLRWLLSDRELEKDQEAKEPVAPIN